MVIWLTGMSGSGKTTLCTAMHAVLKPRLQQLVKLDGDEIRAAFGDDLTHVESDRMRQIHRIQRIAKMLADQGMVVLVAALYAHPDLLAWNRANLPDYFEIYLKADIEFLSTRDSKGLYHKAQRGELNNLVGVDIPWNEPRHADLVIDAGRAKSPDLLALDVLRAIPRIAGVNTADLLQVRA